MIRAGITVYLQQIGESTKEFSVEQGTTIWDILEMAGLPRGTECRVWGDIARENDQPENGETIVVSWKKITQG